MNIYNNHINGLQYSYYIIYIVRNYKYTVLTTTYCSLLLNHQYDVHEKEMENNVHTYSYKPEEATIDIFQKNMNIWRSMK